MACTLEINDPNYELLIKKHKDDTEKALVEFLENYETLKAPKHVYKGMEGKIIYTNRYPSHLVAGVILGDNYTFEEIQRFNKRGFTVVGSSPDVRKAATVTDIQKQKLDMIVGKKAAARETTTMRLSRLNPNEKTGMLENLNLAMELEKKKKDRKKILAMTGWQRSQTDNLWRYEIPETDLIFSEYEKLNAETNEFIFLTDMIPATDAIFGLYPELTKIKIKKLSKTNPFNEAINASYDPRTKTINLKDSVFEDTLKSRLYHEVQHVIQEIEGFPLGGNTSSALQTFSEQQLLDLGMRVEADVREVIYNVTETLRRVKELTAKETTELEKLQKEIDLTVIERNVERRKEDNEVTVNKLNKKITKLKKEMTDIIYPLKEDKYISEILKTYLYEENNKASVKEKLEKIKNRLSLLAASKKEELQKVKKGDKAALSRNMDSNEAYNYYRKLAGEVEARNVQERMNLSNKERRKKLLEETEDIAPEEKIVIFNYSDETNFSLEPSQFRGDIKPGVEELFESNPELANIGTPEQYSQYLNTIFTDSEVTEIDNSLYISVLNQLEQENIIEKDCRGGKLKAKDGIRGKFTKGSQWEIVKDLKGYLSHKDGGVDVKIDKNGVSFTRDNGVIEAKHGLILPKIE